MFEYGAYVGLDVHKETIATAVASPGREVPEYRDILPNRRKSLNRFIDNLQGALQLISLQGFMVDYRERSVSKVPANSALYRTRIRQRRQPPPG